MKYWAEKKNKPCMAQFAITRKFKIFMVFFVFEKLWLFGQKFGIITFFGQIFQKFEDLEGRLVRLILSERVLSSNNFGIYRTFFVGNKYIVFAFLASNAGAEIIGYPENFVAPKEYQ